MCVNAGTSVVPRLTSSFGSGKNWTPQQHVYNHLNEKVDEDCGDEDAGVVTV